MLKNRLNFKIFTLLFLTFQSAFSANLADIQNSSLVQLQDQFDNSGKSLTLGVSISGIQYFSAAATGQAFQQQAEFSTQYKKSFSGYAFGFDGFVGSYSSARSAYFSVAEIYGGLRSENKKNSVYLGRKIEIQSALDERLNTGLYNPYFSDDYVQFKTLGLTGLHAKAQVSVFGLSASYLPFYFPNQGPRIYEESGEIKSPSRWAKKPPVEFQFGSQNREIVYTIKDYSTNDIINSGGYTVSTFIGVSEVRPWIRVSLARKPVSEIPLSRDTFGTATNFSGQVKLLPTVTYANVRSVDIHADLGIFESTLSYLGDQPENKMAAENETLQYLEPLNIYGVAIRTDLSKWLGHNLQTEVSYAEINGGEIKDLMADGRPSLFTFSAERTLYKKPLSLGIRSDLTIWGSNPVVTSVKWTYDQFYKGSLLTTHVRYETMKNMNINVGFDLLGVEDNTPATNHFLKLNQANDRFYGGLDYVF